MTEPTIEKFEQKIDTSDIPKKEEISEVFSKYKL